MIEKKIGEVLFLFLTVRHVRRMFAIMKSNELSYSIYQGTERIAIFEAEPREAYRVARSYVRQMAHADGVQSERLIGNTIESGIYRAVPTYKEDRRY